jgi:photosystem II stability/assembly factor-like uncharacterized protein
MKKIPILGFLFIFILVMVLNQNDFVSAGNLENQRTTEKSRVSAATHVYLPLIMVDHSYEPTVEPIGPAGGTFPAFIVDPITPSNLYLGTWGAGVYASDDKGASWTAMNEGLRNLMIQSLAIDPNNNEIIYAGTYSGGIYRSTDGGRHWKTSNGNSLTSHIIYDIEIDPQQPTTLYSASRISGSLVGYVHKSTNSGQSWQEIFRGDRFNTDDYFYDIDVNPKNSNDLFLAAHEHGFYRSTNGGSSWTAVNNGVTDLSSRSLAIDPTTTSTIYGGVWHGAGVFKTTNSGTSWVEKGSGFPTDVEVYRLVLDPAGDPANRQIYACTYENGMYRSSDSAANWTSAGLSNYFVYDFGIAGTSPKKIFAATGGRGLYSSIDLGQSWQKSNKGVFNTNITGLASIPEKPQAVFAAVNGSGIYKTIDQGKSWSSVNSGLSNVEVNFLYSLDGDLYALTTGATYVSQTGDSWAQLAGPEVLGFSISDYMNSIIERSNYPEELLQDFLKDQVESIKESEPSVTYSPLISISKLGGKIYGGTPGRGAWLYNGGMWTQIGMESQRVYALAGDPALNRMLSSSCVPDAVTGQDRDCRVMYYAKNDSDDWTWTWINQGLSGVKTNFLLVRGDDYFAATRNGIFIRDNDGSTWTRVGLEGVNVLALAVDSTNVCKLYAAAAGGAYSSDNCGLTWLAAARNLSGWTFQSVSVAPQNSDAIYFGSKQAGTFLLDRQP